MDSKSIDQKLRVLQFQNQNLSAQLETQRKEINSLQEKVTLQQSKHDEYAQTVLCVSRLWEQLLTDIAFLSLRATGELPDHTANAIKIEVKDEDGEAQDIPDPFLQKLLHIDCNSPSQQINTEQVNERHTSLTERLTMVEKHLVARTGQTKAILAKLLDIIQQARERSATWDAGLQAANADEALKQEMYKIRQEHIALTQQLDTMAAQRRLAEEELSQQKDRQMEAEQKLQKLQNELADKEEEYTIIQKKYYSLKMAGVDQVQPHPAPRPPVPTPPAAGESSTPPAAAAQPPPGGSGMLDLQQQLAQRDAEVDREREASLKLQRELQELRARVSSDAYATQTELYKAAKRESVSLRATLAERLTELEALQRERDAAADDRNLKNHHVLMMAELSRQLAEREKNVRELLADKESLKTRAADLEAKMQALREEAGNQRSAAELSSMMKVLQREVELARSKDQRGQATAQKVEKLSAELQEAAKKLAVAEAEAERSKERLRELEDSSAVGKGREEGLRVKVDDLQVFVDVLTTFCDDDRDVAKVRHSEATLQHKLAAVDQGVQGQEVQRKLREAEEEVSSSRRAAEAAGAEADGLKGQVAALQRQVTDLRKDVGALQEDSNSLMREIEVTAGAYEDMQAQNQRLLQQLSERDEANNALLGERIQANQLAATLKEEGDAAKAEAERCRREAAELATLRDKLSAEVTHLVGELSQAREGSRGLSQKVEELKQALADAEEAAAQLRLQLEAAEKLAGEHKKALDEELERSALERGKRQRLEEEAKVLQAKVERLKKSQNVTAEMRELGAEVEGMRKMLNCNVCHERRKDVILTKCWHMFCNHCIRRNLETRHRKCPGCGAAFGQADVKHFYFT